MAREVVINTLCDPCLSEEVRTGGVEVSATLGELGPKPQVIALCPSHRKALYEPLRDLLEQMGQGDPSAPESSASSGTGKGRRAPNPTRCPQCSHESPNRSALGAHARAMHKKTLGELEGTPLAFPCPECERGFTRPQALGAHLYQTHGVAGTSSAAAANNPKKRRVQQDTLVEAS